MKRAPRSRQRHDLYAKYHDYDSEISDLLGECGENILVVDRCLAFYARDNLQPLPFMLISTDRSVRLLAESIERMFHARHKVLQHGISDITDEEIRLRMAIRKQLI